MVLHNQPNDLMLKKWQRVSTIRTQKRDALFDMYIYIVYKLYLKKDFWVHVVRFKIHKAKKFRLWHIPLPYLPLLAGKLARLL